jgi:Cu/Ag efflux pump CusA
MEKKKLYWRICCFAAVFLVIITFTPIVIPQGVSKPMLGNIPYSLWTSFIITVLLVSITFIGTRVHPGMQDEEDKL